MFDLKSFFEPDEQPLDNLVSDGGFCGIFRTIACVGDSLSSGEYELVTPDGARHYNDMFEYSWGQYMARMAGCKVYNFSRGGMTAKEYMESFGEANNFFDPEKAAQAYIFALGCNDILNISQAPGSLDDIHDDDPSKNADTFAGWMGRLVARYKEIAPDAKFFFVTMPMENLPSDPLRRAQGEIMYMLAEHYSNSYVIDLAKYMPVYDQDFKDKFFLEGHMNPMGYLLTGKVMVSYIDYIIRHDLDNFKHVGYINTELSASKIEQMKRDLAAKKD